LHLTKSRGWEAIFPTIISLPKGPEPLQAADLIAYEGSTYSSRHVIGSSKRDPRELYRILKDTCHVLFSTVSRQILVDHIGNLLNARDTATPEEIAEINARYDAARQKMQSRLDPQFNVTKKQNPTSGDGE
jgi:hypothetical protein